MNFYVYKCLHSYHDNAYVNVIIVIQIWLFSFQCKCMEDAVLGG